MTIAAAATLFFAVLFHIVTRTLLSSSAPGWSLTAISRLYHYESGTADVHNRRSRPSAPYPRLTIM
jgi:hypothetical protein